MTFKYNNSNEKFNYCEMYFQLYIVTFKELIFPRKIEFKNKL